ncbi:hypothetical protein P152DRAFT_263568 [Eremomyces bilateralis CBS 781.70]|uniref:Uncharacterized protein n=1 Tax=Eremomyces bilateralis CBS 781.70 TaxID=1392243 RepID=A0A6G1G8F1_9PEZI|nr:uncharacterized protein P152DRAFT_263568 [Eremomyces bilateralis CBS 781.70]KAF1814201.1 hypothetical protein P152DRAFT_263568 [Eremomyces bilateralis CBS 781.70]
MAGGLSDASGGHQDHFGESTSLISKRRLRILSNPRLEFGVKSQNRYNTNSSWYHSRLSQDRSRQNHPFTVSGDEACSTKNQKPETGSKNPNNVTIFTNSINSRDTDSYDSYRQYGAQHLRMNAYCPYRGVHCIVRLPRRRGPKKVRRNAKHGGSLDHKHSTTSSLDGYFGHVTR